MPVAQRLLPQGVADLLRQILLFCGAYMLYRVVRGVVEGRAGAAFENARRVIRLEHHVGVFVEPAVQAWTIGTGSLIDVASWLYVNCHFTVTFGTLAFIYLFRNEHFYFVRNMFMVAMGIALVVYLLFPTAPPRMMTEWGFIDSVSDFTGVSSNSSISVLFNPYAAVPSMHVGMALMVGVSLARLVKPLPLKILWSLYPVFVTFVVVATGNHYFTDVFLGALTAAVSALLAKQLLARAKPDAWAFGQVPA
jgi:membrane-associated phospholipid phosphatase